MVNKWDVAIRVEVLKREGEKKRNSLAIQNHY